MVMAMVITYSHIHTQKYKSFVHTQMLTRKYYKIISLEEEKNTKIKSQNERKKIILNVYKKEGKVS